MVELRDLNTGFSEWVRMPSEGDGFIFEGNSRDSDSYTDDEFNEALQSWLENPSAGVKRFKKFTRLGVRPNLRKDFWLLASGGKTVQLGFRETIQDMEIQIPSRIPPSIFNGLNESPTIYFLNSEGHKMLLEVLYVLSCVHPDIHYCPLLPPLAAIFLHFMDKDQCYACMVSILDSKNSLLDQSQRSVAVTAKSFQDCLKDKMMPTYKRIKAYARLLKEKDIPKGSVLVPDWLVWMFHCVDFWTLVHVVDNLLIQGPKVLIRAGLIVFNQFSKSLKKQGVSLDMGDLFQSFVKSMPLRGSDFIEAAFNIRGLSQKKLQKLKIKNMVLLEEGKIDVPQQPQSQMPNLAVFTIQDSDFLSLEQWEALRCWLPERLHIKRPVCIFSTERDGCSIKTLYTKCGEEADTVLLVKTADEEIIGAFLTSPWSDRTSGTKSLSFFGTGESFVFSLSPRPAQYRWTQKLDYFMAGDDTCLQVGGGGDNALWLDAGFRRGHSGKSETFGNERLTTDADFVCLRVEVLGFVSET